MDRISESGQETSAEISGEIGNQSPQVPLPSPEDPEYWLADSAEDPAESFEPEVTAESVDPNGAGWFKRALAGAAIAFAVVLLSLLFLHIRIATEGPGADPNLLSPSEFWTTVQGLLVTWFPMAWVLGGLGLGLSAVAYLVNRRTRSLPRLAGGLALLATLLMAGVVYQQFLRQVSLSLDQAKIGVALSRQLQSNDTREELSKYLAQVGQGGKVLVRRLPVSLDASETDRARDLANRIGADVVVIFGAPDAEAISASASTAPPQRSQGQFVAHIALADPGVGSEVPVPQRSADGSVNSVEFRAKAAVEAPRVQTSNWDRLLEATAGIVMYEQDRYLPAITHLRNAVSQNRSDRSDGLILYYLGSAQFLAGEEEQAGQSLNEAIGVFDGRPTLTIEEHLLLAHTYSARASVHLHAHELDQAEALLQKAAELRGPVDKDRSALDHPSDLRRFHETFGTVYLQLMDVASRREDPGAEEAWRSRSRGEANALLKLKGDDLARSTGIWLLYRTGGCEQAYRVLTDDLAEDPDDLRARRAISQLAALRTGLGTPESDQQIAELLRRHPHNLHDHQRKLLGSALQAADRDLGYLQDGRMTLDRLLELDPVNLPALEELVTSTESYSRLYLNPSAAGHAPTFRSLQRGLLGDPQHARAVVDYIDKARPQLKRWAELQPESAAPFVAQLRLSLATESWLYNHIHVVPVSDPSRQPDPGMIELYDRVWREAVEEGESLLASTKQETNRDLIRTHVVLGEIWLHRYFATLTGDPPAADDAMTRASTHMEKAVELAPQLGPFIDEVNLAHRSYLSMFTVFGTARPHYESKGESSRAERMDRLARQALTGIEATSAQSLADTQKRSQRLARRTCKSGDFMRAGRELLRRGEYRPAIQVLTDYVGLYPKDPEGHRELGWAHFKNGALDRARESMQQYHSLAPDDPQAAAKLGAVYLAEGRQGLGAEQIDRSLKLIDRTPLGLRLQQLSLTSGDLLEVAREHERSHPAVAEAVSRIHRYIGTLPPKARTLEGARLVQVLSATGAAAAWAGETASAERLLNEGLEINADHVLLRATLGFAKLEGGDPAGARVQYEKAVASGPRYLQDWAGRPLGSADLEQAKQLLKQELEASAAALDALGGRVDVVHAPAVELAAMLRSAAASV